jgi:Gram-negative bacterial TonB protein C-terminal
MTFRSKMTTKSSFTALLLLASLLGANPAAAQTRATSKTSGTPDSLFIVTEAVSDAFPFWFKYVLDLVPTETGTSAKWIRLAPFGNACPGATVKAMTATVPKSLSSIVSPKLCSLSVSKVEKAISSVTRNASIWDSAAFGIVAKCGSETKVFHLPLGDLVDMDRLKRDSKEAASLYDLYYQLVKEGFQGKSFYKNSESADRELQEAGSILVDELRSGKYDAALSGPDLSSKSLKTFLADYRGVRHDADGIEGWIEVDNSTKERLTHYVEPIYSRLAITARISGPVELALVVDDSGNVQDAVANGNRLLEDNAKNAAKQWKFKSGAISGAVRATLQFGLGGRCD